MNEKVLFVDDEQNILDGIKRQLRKKVSVETALGPVEGLKAINKKGPFAVVISDIRMPLIDGIKFLTRVRQSTPESVRMILTGNADLENAMKSVNDGHVFRFLTKPCSTEVLLSVIQSGIEQYRLIRAEKELLEQTLSGSIRLLTEILAMLSPMAFGRAARVKRYATAVANSMKVPEIWKMETSAMLSQIGLITDSEKILDKLYKDEELSREEREIYDRSPQVAFNLLNNIPRMQEVAEIIREEGALAFSSETGEKRGVEGNACTEARILKAVLDFDLLLAREGNEKQAFHKLRERAEHYDPVVLESIEEILERPRKYEEKTVSVADLERGMIIKEDVSTMDGILLVSRGHEVDHVTIEHLKNYARSGQGVKEPIHVQASVFL